MTYARVRLWVGVSGVGTVVLASAAGGAGCRQPRRSSWRQCWPSLPVRARSPDGSPGWSRPIEHPRSPRSSRSARASRAASSAFQVGSDSSCPSAGPMANRAEDSRKVTGRRRGRRVEPGRFSGGLAAARGGRRDGRGSGDLRAGTQWSFLGLLLPSVSGPAVFLSWAGMGLLSRAVHCNSGRPELWALLPCD